jgi:flagella basal body P-ring formation protein FlgA
MMKSTFKIILLILLLVPFWLTIAFAGSATIESQAEWRKVLDSKLAHYSENERHKVQEITWGADQLAVHSPADFSGLRVISISQTGPSRIEIQVGSERMQIQVKLLSERLTPVASAPLSRGHVIAESDIQWEWIPIRELGGRVASLNQLLGKELRQPVSQQSPFSTSTLQKPVLIKSGDRVQITLMTGALKVSSFGLARESGTLGQTIRVMNPETRKEILGRVTSERDVEVSL